MSSRLADLAVELHGSQEDHLEDVAAYSGGGAEGGVQQQCVALGPQVSAELGCQRLSRLLQHRVTVALHFFKRVTEASTGKYW